MSTHECSCDAKEDGRGDCNSKSTFDGGTLPRLAGKHRLDLLRLNHRYENHPTKSLKEIHDDDDDDEKRKVIEIRMYHNYDGDDRSDESDLPKTLWPDGDGDETGSHHPANAQEHRKHRHRKCLKQVEIV